MIPRGRWLAWLVWATMSAVSAAAFGETAGPTAGAMAKLPERTIDPADLREAPGGRTVPVPAGSDLQRALDKAQPGDTLVLDPGASYSGPLVLRKKNTITNGNPWITIRGAAVPAPGARATPSEGESMPKLVGTRGPAIYAAPGANHYRIIGLEIRPRAGEFIDQLIVLGENSMPTAQLPHDLVFARCFVHGDPLFGGRRGFALNSGAAAIVDSWVSDFKEQGADSQAIAGWSGTGPFLIANNYLEGAGENLMFGGADPPGPDRVPSDIEIRGNSLVKPLSWKRGTASFTGAEWSVKNLLELKDARRVLIEGNVLAHNWAQSQNGFGVLFTVRNQEGHAPYSVVEDVTFAGNWLRGSGSGVNILGRDDSHGGQSGLTSRIDIRDNRLDDIGGDWGGSGVLFQLLQGPAGVVIEHNTGLQTGSVLVAEGPPAPGFVFRNNIVAHNQYGITGTGAGTGTTALAAFFPGSKVDGNVFIGGNAGQYPKGNFFVGAAADVFADPDQHQPRPRYAAAGATPSAFPELSAMP